MSFLSLYFVLCTSSSLQTELTSAKKPQFLILQFLSNGGAQGSRPVAKFIVPDRGDKINSGIRLSYRPAKLRTVHRLASKYDNHRQPYAGSRSQQYPPVRDYEFGYWINQTVRINCGQQFKKSLRLMFHHDRRSKSVSASLQQLNQPIQFDYCVIQKNVSR